MPTPIPRPPQRLYADALRGASLCSGGNGAGHATIESPENDPSARGGVRDTGQHLLHGGRDRRSCVRGDVLGRRHADDRSRQRRVRPLSLTGAADPLLNRRGARRSELRRVRHLDRDRDPSERHRRGRKRHDQPGRHRSVPASEHGHDRSRARWGRRRAGHLGADAADAIGLGTAGISLDAGGTADVTGPTGRERHRQRRRRGRCRLRQGRGWAR